MNLTMDTELIELEDSEDENEDEDDDDEDANGFSTDAVPFREKVEKWLIDCNGAQARALIKDSERIFQEKTVVVKEVIDRTESLHSVDTEQYIKSNRRKTTTKVTTTTIKKYFSVMKVDQNVYNNNMVLPAPTINAAEDEKFSCKVIRKSPRKPSNNLLCVPESKQPKVNKRKRNHQRKQEPDTNRLSADDNSCSLLELNHDIPANGSQNSNDRIKTARKSMPYNTRPNDKVNHRIRLCAELCNNRKIPRRAPATKKQYRPSMTKACRVKLKSFDHCASPVLAEVNPKPTTAALRNVQHSRSDSEDSEDDDILLTSYKPFSLCP